MGTITNYTINGKCSNCGQCCSDILHLDAKEITQIDKYLKGRKLEQHNKGENNLNCPFRNDITRTCEIYEARPLICQRFKCDISPEEAFEKRDFINNKKKPRSMAELFFKDDSKIKFMERELHLKIYKRGEK